MASIPMAFESPPRRGRSTKPDWNDRRPCRSMTSPSNRESPSSREIKSCRSPKDLDEADRAGGGGAGHGGWGGGAGEGGHRPLHRSDRVQRRDDWHPDDRFRG